MPYRPRKAVERRNEAGLTEDQIMHLLHGWCLDTMYHPYYKLNGDLQFPFRDHQHRRELYFENKDYIFSLAGRGKVDGLYCELKAGEKPQAYFDYEGVKNDERKS